MSLALIIGSTAARHWWPDFPRPAKDLDYFAKDPEAQGLWSDRRGDVFWDQRMLRWMCSRQWNGSSFATPDELYTIKVSHSYWVLNNGSWDKHIFDILWMQKRGCKLDQYLHDMLYECWEDKHGRKKVNLQMEADDFFADVVNRLYDHDSIHESVAYGDHARYLDVLRDGATVDIDMAKVKALPFDDKVKLYREEIAATALERIIIPSEYKESPGRAWKWALRRTITSLTKGWSAQFLVENLIHFVTPDSYVTRHLNNKHKLILLET